MLLAIHSDPTAPLRSALEFDILQTAVADFPSSLCRLFLPLRHGFSPSSPIATFSTRHLGATLGTTLEFRMSGGPSREDFWARHSGHMEV